MADVVALGFWVVWGAGTPIVYGLLLRKRRHHYQIHRDRRALRAAMESIGYFMVAIAASLALAVALLASAGGIAAILSGIASAIFFTVGVYALLESPDGAGRAS